MMGMYRALHACKFEMRSRSVRFGSENRQAGKTLRCFCGKIGNARQAQASGLAQRRKALSVKSSKNTLSRSTLSSISSSMRFQRNCTKNPMKA